MDIFDELGKVNRAVEDRGQQKSVIIRRTYATPIDAVWDACTNPQQLARWFEPASGDLREGGRYRLDGSGTTGTIEQCSAPTRLRITWEYGGESSPVELTLDDTNGGTTLQLVHVVPENDHWQTYGPGATGIGWDGSLLALGLHLAGDTRAEPEEMQKFNATSEGHEFIRQAAAAWQAAHVVAGAPGEQAQAAAGRTAAFYTGTSET